MQIMTTSFKIRRAAATDVPALAALHVTTFNETHGAKNAPTVETRQWQWHKAFQETDNSWFCLVVENNGSLIGFAKGAPNHHSDHAAYAGELNKIYLLQQYQKIGLGRQLVCSVANEFIQRNITSMLLFGDARSPSNGFYERMNAEKLFAKNGDFHGGYGWRDLKELADTCKEK